LRIALDEAWEQAEPGADHVITRYRDANQNLRTTFEKIIRRAGLTPWPKLFHNLRASRATELANEFPAHLAAAWLGHSTLIANKHYWQVTDEDIAAATTPADPAARKAAQKAAQQALVLTGGDSHAVSTPQKKTPVLHVPAMLCGIVQTGAMGDEGLEPPTSSV
jgi:hypothetical protein